MTSKHFAACAALAAAALVSASAAAQGVMLNPGFQPDPMQVTGNAGGTTDAGTIQAGCMGQLSATPNHTFSLTQPLPSLRFSVTAADDTTLLVRGPDGVRCNDDTNGVNPEVSGAFGAGTYEVFVGTYYGGTTPYTLEVGTGSAGAAAVAVAPPVQNIPPQPTTPVVPPTPPAGQPAAVPTTSHQLPAGFAPDPMTASGAVSPSVDLTTRGPNVWGWAGDQPNHVLTLPADLPYLRISVTSDSDTVLLVEGPGAQLFNDDTNGLNPEVSGAFTAGTYRVFVGSYSQTPASYSIAFTTHGGAPATSSTSISPGFLPDPVVLTGTSGGTVAASDLGVTPTGPCRGQIAAAPNHTFVAEQAFSYLRVQVQASSDTTLVVEGPNGRRCNDDSDGFNPAIEGAYPAGTYNIWVGAYSAPGAYTLNITEYGR